MRVCTGRKRALTDPVLTIVVVPAAVPGPIAGAGLPGLIGACAGLFGLNRWRRKRRVTA